MGVDKGNFKLRADIDTKPIQDAKSLVYTIQGHIASLEQKMLVIENKKAKLMVDCLKAMALLEEAGKKEKELRVDVWNTAEQIRTMLAAMVMTETLKRQVEWMIGEMKNLSEERTALQAKIDKLKDDLLQAKKDIDVAEAKTKSTSMQSWHVLNSLMHSADSILDRAVDGYSQTFGTVFSVMLSVTNSIKTAAVAIQATGPVGMAQDMAILLAAGISSGFQVQGMADAQRLKAYKNYIGELEASNAPW
jgi:chromosome segregation ATPase